LAQRTGKTKRALHLYEEKGLLVPADRSKGGFRLYDDDNVRRIAFIDRMRLLGLSLAEVQKLLRKWSASDSVPHTMAQEYRVQLADVRAKLSALKALEQELVASLEFLEGCRNCDDHSASGREACSSCARKEAEAGNRLTLISGVTAH
jgi:DNA-binding transcriptional MerR regulator